MFLSPQVSFLEADGSLVVDLVDECGPRLRFGPIEAGMDWARWEGGCWHPVEHDPGFRLVTPAHLSRRQLPVLSYIVGLSSRAVDALMRLGHLQTSVLQMYARSAAAQDLLRTILPLIWLAAAEYEADPGQRGQLLDRLEQTQREVLRYLLRKDVRPAQVHFLKKLVLDGADRRVFDEVRSLVADEEAVLRLRHWQHIPGQLVPLLAEAPGLAAFNLFRQEVNEGADDYDFRRILSQRVRLVRDTIRLARLLRVERGGESVLCSCQAWSRVQVLHDRLLKTMHAAGARSLLDADVDPFRPFPAAPIPASSTFVPIESAAELATEGEIMHHCVLTRAREAMAGRSAIYRVNIPKQRGTIEISIDPSGEPVAIEDFRLACNAAPDVKAWAIANEWLYGGRRRWNEQAAAPADRCARQVA